MNDESMMMESGLDVANETGGLECDTTQPKPDEVCISESAWHAFFKGEAVLADLYALDRKELFEIAQQGELFLNSGQIAKAQKTFEALCALDPHIGEFHCALGIVYQRQGELERAKIEYDRALTLNEEDTTALVNRAELMIELQDIDGAINDLANLHTIDPSGDSIQCKKARALAQALSAVLMENADVTSNRI